MRIDVFAEEMGDEFDNNPAAKAGTKPAAKAGTKPAYPAVRDKIRNAMIERDFGLKFYGYCRACRKRISRDEVHAGHVISVAKCKESGIPFEIGNSLENLRSVCASCNLSMGTMCMFDFCQMLRPSAKPADGRLWQISAVAAALFGFALCSTQDWQARHMTIAVMTALCFASSYASLWFWQLQVDAARWREIHHVTAVDSDSPFGQKVSRRDAEPPRAARASRSLDFDEPAREPACEPARASRSLDFDEPAREPACEPARASRSLDFGEPARRSARIR